MLSAEFFESHYLKAPFSSSGGARLEAESAGLDTLDRVLRAIPPADVLVSRAGKPIETEPPRSREAADRLLAEGCSVALRGVQAYDEKLGALAERFRGELDAPIVVQLFYTPGGAKGFDWHYDIEEVFLVQVLGTKDYHLRPNTVSPNPLEMGRDLHYERELSPRMVCTLAPGDWLYLPAGYWHSAEALERSLTISIGAAPATAFEALDLVREYLSQSPRWRRRLPPRLPGAGEPWEAYHAAFRELLEEIRVVLGDPRFAKLYARRRHRRGTPLASHP